MESWLVDGGEGTDLIEWREGFAGAQERWAQSQLAGAGLDKTSPPQSVTVIGEEVKPAGNYSRERSWRLRCSLLLKALEQNWHLYFFSGAREVLREAVGGDKAAGRAATLAPGMISDSSSRGRRVVLSRVRDTSFSAKVIQLQHKTICKTLANVGWR